VAGGFVLAIVLVAWGGWTLWRSMESHRATADETLRDHASYMALNYSGMFSTEAWYTFRGPLIAAQQAAQAPGRQTVDQLVAAVAAQSFESTPPRVVPLRFFAGDSSGWRATTAGDDGGVDGALAERLRRRMGDSLPPSVAYRGTVVVRGADTTLAVIQPRRTGTGWVGFEVALPTFREVVLTPGPARTQAFFDRVLDSLPERWPGRTALVPISVTLHTDDGAALLEYNPPIPDGWTMQEWAIAPLSAQVRVTVGPDAVPYLMPGGYPPTPGPRVAAVIILALLLLGGTAVLAWRTLAVSRIREEFTHAVSHELRTPLANIHLYAETLLLERITDPVARRAALETITRETRRLGDMVENVLATARMARAEEALHPSPDRIGRLVHEVLDAFQPVLASRRIEVDVDLVGDDVATIDADAVRRILVNLLDNAIRHGPEGQRLRVVVDHTREEVLLVVEDEGPGIPAADRERVWLPYARGEGGGSGLGLAVVRHLARLHGGDAVVGDHDAGARIEVRLAAHAEAR
jgi:signal transduction histidine kinase